MISGSHTTHGKKKLHLANVERTYMQVVFENCIFEIEDEMSTELLLWTRVKVQDIACGTNDSINFHQLIANILQMQKKKGTIEPAKQALILW